MSELPRARELLAASVHDAGFEVLGAVSIAAYNASLEERFAAYRLPELIDHESAGALLVVGNTRRLWPLFTHAYASTALREEAHPLDQYSRIHIGRAVDALHAELGLRTELRFSFDPPPNTVAIQRLAVLASVAELAPIGLCIHPEHGPWLSLRAAVAIAVPGPAPSAPPPTCSVCTAKPCLAPREKVLALGAASVTRAQLSEHWETWLAMRDACPIGREAHRYSDAQIRYHYLKDKRLLQPSQK